MESNAALITILAKGLFRNELPDTVTGSAEQVLSRPLRGPKTEKYLCMNLISGSRKTSNPSRRTKSSMKLAQHLIKLKVETIGDLKRLRSQIATKSLGNLIAKMVKLTDAHHAGLKDFCWGSNSIG